MGYRIIHCKTSRTRCVELSVVEPNEKRRFIFTVWIRRIRRVMIIVWRRILFVAFLLSQRHVVGLIIVSYLLTINMSFGNDALRSPRRRISLFFWYQETHDVLYPVVFHPVKMSRRFSFGSTTLNSTQRVRLVLQCRNNCLISVVGIACMFCWLIKTIFPFQKTFI